MDVYLFQCNKIRDIENNIDEVQVPEFTIENVNKIDSNYKRYFSDIIPIEYELEDNKYDKRFYKRIRKSITIK